MSVSPEDRSTRRMNHNNNGKSNSDNDKAVLQSIAASQTALTPNKMVSVVIYIPTSSVGAVIGRKGQNITALQKLIASTTPNSGSSSAGGNPRVSVVGQNDPPDSMPYTYTPLDWSNSANWTPVVIRTGDACGALTAATRILALAKDVHDGVVLDLPLPAHRHAALVGKRGMSLATFSADHGVRIFVPHKELKHDVVQLEGDLSAVKACLRDILQSVANRSCKKVIEVEQLPSQPRLRQIQRRTLTTVRKKKIETVNSEGKTVLVWQLTITGQAPEKLESVAALIQSAPPRGGGTNTDNNATGGKVANTTSDGTSSRRRARGKARAANYNKNKNNQGSVTPNTSPKAAPQSEEAETPESSRNDELTTDA